MGIHRMKEGVTRKTPGAAGGVELGLAAVAVDDVIACIAWIRWVGDTKLRVIENVVGFGAKLDIEAFLKGFEVLEERHVEVCTRGVSEIVAA